MRALFSKYGGLIFGILYGLIMRLVFNISLQGDLDFFTLSSITFIWIVPIVIGITPMLFASKDQLASIRYKLLVPSLTVCLFFLITFVARIEDFICIMFLSIPFTLCAAFGGFIFGNYIESYKRRKGILYSILLLPFFTAFIEHEFETPSSSYKVETSVVINATPKTIWQNIIRVKQIDEHEYSKGFFNYAGIPRPLFAELNKDTIDATRIGHFDGGLTFTEKVITWERNKAIAFDIKINLSSLRQTVFDRHVLKGGHFKFINACYTLRQIDINKTKLILSSSYQLDTKVNGYASYWGDALLTDFQERLLQVIKNRCDKKRM